jgi:hypothetical protein
LPSAHPAKKSSFKQYLQNIFLSLLLTKGPNNLKYLPWQAFPAKSNVCSKGQEQEPEQEPTLHGQQSTLKGVTPDTLKTESGAERTNFLSL